MAHEHEGDVDLPVFTDAELELYRLQTTAVVARILGVWDFIPRTEEDWRAIVRNTAPDVLPMLDALNHAYSEFCRSARNNASDQWDRRNDADLARKAIIKRLEK